MHILRRLARRSISGNVRMNSTLSFTRKAFVGVTVCGALVCFIYGLYFQHRVSSFRTRANEEAVQDKTENPQVCKFPELDPFDPAVLPHIKKYPPLSCVDGMPSLVYLNQSYLYVNRTKLIEKFSNRKFSGCRHKKLTMKATSDMQVDIGKASALFTDFVKLNIKDDNLLIECFDKNNLLLSRSYMYIVHKDKRLESRCRETYKKHQMEFNPKETLSVLLIGIDGMSKQNLARTMPKTREFVIKQMGGLELKKYNKVGLNTFPNLMPLLTGRHHDEFEDEWSWKEHFDKINYAFIWNDFRQAGYRTSAMVGDRTTITAFHYAKHGWLQPYVDYNSRAMVVAHDLDKKVWTKRLCLGDIPQMVLLNDQWIQMTSMFNNTPTTPYFGFHFASKLTHDDCNVASSGDDIYHAFFSKLLNNRVLNNTLIVFFSDHGQRWGSIMSTFNGKIEGNLPFVFLIFPPWFFPKYPEIHRTLKLNQHRLTTPFDLYATLQSVINFDGSAGKGDYSHRSISLFKEIPEARTCENAGIPNQFCACFHLVNSSVNSTVVHRLSESVLDQVRIKTLNNRSLCHELHLDKVVSLLEIQKPSNDNQTNTAEKTFKITLQTKPGGALFEAGLKLSKTLNVLVEDLLRINMYRGTAECIQDVKKMPFCYCIEKPDSKFWWKVKAMFRS